MPGPRLYDSKPEFQTIETEYDFLIPLLEKKMMNYKEIQAAIIQHGNPNATYHTAITAINVLTRKTTLYEDDLRPGLYKIRTRQEEIEYENKHKKNIIGEQYEW